MTEAHAQFFAEFDALCGACQPVAAVPPRASASDFKWKAANNGAGKMRWFVCRNRRNAAERAKHGSLEYHARSNGDLIRFASHTAAAARAQVLNAQAPT